MKNNTITVELIGSYIARHVESGTTLDTHPRRNRPTTKGPISPLCRKLIEQGLVPATRVHVIRRALGGDGFISVFKRDRTLAAWADVDCIENERHGPTAIKYVPFPDGLKRKNERLASGRTDSASETSRGKIALTKQENVRSTA